MIRKRLNCTEKRTKPEARDITKVVMVVPSLPSADPAEPLRVPLITPAMPDIVRMQRAREISLSSHSP